MNLYAAKTQAGDRVVIDLSEVCLMIEMRMEAHTRLFFSGDLEPLKIAEPSFTQLVRDWDNAKRHENATHESVLHIIGGRRP
jgi:hypothetical protein